MVALQRCSSHLRLHPEPRPHVQRRRSLVGAVAVTSCRRLHPRSAEVSVIDPHAVQDHGELARHGNHCPPVAACLGQAQPPKP